MKETLLDQHTISMEMYCAWMALHCTAVDRPTAAAQHQTGVAAVLLWQSDGGLRRAHISPA